MIWYAWVSGLATAFAILRFGAGEYTPAAVDAVLAAFFFWRAYSMKHATVSVPTESR